MAKTQHITQVDAAGAAEPLLAGSSARKAYRAHDSRLPEDAWKDISDLLVDVAQERLTLVSDLEDAGLINSIGMGSTVSTWQESNDFQNAETDMDGRTDAPEDASIWVTRGVPVPIHHINFRVGHREDAAEPDLQPGNIQKAMRSCMRRLENVVLNGWGQVMDARGDSFEIYGYRTHPDREQHAGATWSNAANVETDLRSMIGKAEGNNYYGPYQLYIAGDLWAHLRAPSPDFDNQRVRQTIEDLSEISSIKPVDHLPPGEAILVQMTSDVVDAVAAGDLVQTAEWNHTPFETRVKTFSVFAPRIKADNSTQSGIVHAAGMS